MTEAPHKLEAPADSEALLATAAEAYGRGDYADAETIGIRAFQATPSAAASNLIGLSALARGATAEAIAYLRRAAELDPDDAEYPNNLGFVLHAAGDFDGARLALETALSIDPAMAHAANNLGSVLEKLEEPARAIALYRRALRIDPVFIEARDNLLAACAKAAPLWHFPMMADAPRNAAYAEALARVVSGRRVLDIGSGSGLLAMMAARAGAAHVDTCEMQPLVAAAATSVVAANGLAPKVSVWSMKSDQLRIGAELAAGADVLVTETFSSNLLSEDILATMEDAHERLLAPGAAIIPQRAAAIGRLIGGGIIEGHLFARPWSDLDLSAFDQLAPEKVGLHLDRLSHETLSEDFEIFGFDLAAHAFPSERRQLDVPVTAEGRCVGVAQWIRLDLDSQTTYENRPDASAGANGWMHVVYRFPRPLAVRPGDRVRLVASHNRRNLAVGLDAAIA